MARGYCVQSSNLQERVPGMAMQSYFSGTSAHRKGQEINHVLGEAAAEHAVNTNQGNAHQVIGNEMRKEFMKPWRPSAVRRILIYCEMSISVTMKRDQKIYFSDLTKVVLFSQVSPMLGL